MIENVNILIGTPAYGSQVHTDYLHSIIDFHRNKLNFSVMTIGNESLITRGRNTIISTFYKMEQFTHLLYLDADMFLSGESLINLINHNKDVIGAPVPLKGYDENGNPVFNVGSVNKVDNSDNLITTDRLGTAVFMLSRKAINSLVENAKNNNDVYSPNPNTRGDKQQMQQYDIFKVGVVDGAYLSEDYFVCHILNSLGYDVYVDTSVKVRHSGNYTFSS